MNSSKTESHYKVLGTTAKIGQRRIREKYIEAVKKHPPESDPEMFEKIRAAYETLKNPVKRKEYDLFRKYGNKVEMMIHKAFTHFKNDELKQAEVLLERALVIVPDNAPSLIGMTRLSIIENDLQRAKMYFQRVIDGTEDPAEQAYFYTIKARFLILNEYREEALQLLDEGKRIIPEQLLAIDVARAYLHRIIDEPDEAWAVFVQLLKTHEIQGEEFIEFYMTLFTFFIDTEQWQQKEWLKKQFRSFLKTLENEETRQDFSDLLMDEYGDQLEHGHYLGAELFLDLASMMNPSSKEIQKKQQEIKKMALIQKEVLRLEADQQAYPLLYIRSVQWLYENEHEISQMLALIPEGMLIDLEESKEEYAASILYLRKKYPLIYKHFKKRWDDLFAELTIGFNREMKRMLNKMK